MLKQSTNVSDGIIITNNPYVRSRLRLLRFLIFGDFIVLTVLLREQLFQILRRLAGNILNSNALADIGGVVRMALCGVDIQIPDELVVDNKALGLMR